MGYLDRQLTGDGLTETVENCVDLLTEKDVRFDTIAVRGMSGILVGAPLAMDLEKDIIIIRKDEDMTHSCSKAEGWGFNQKILIVDDFIESGNTIDHIYETIIETCDSPKIVGILLYADPNNRKRYKHPDGTNFKVFSVKR